MAWRDGVEGMRPSGGSVNLEYAGLLPDRGAAATLRHSNRSFKVGGAKQVRQQVRNVLQFATDLASVDAQSSPMSTNPLLISWTGRETHELRHSRDLGS